MSASPPASPRRPAVRAVLIGGGIAGACDITYAIVFTHFRGVSVERLLQSVATGLLGKAAYEGGSGTAALGLGLHFLVAFIWAALFYVASSRVPALIRRPILAGAIYGIFIFGFMNLVVLPLSAFPHPIVFRPLATVTGLAVHAFLIGGPIALASRASLAPRAGGQA